MMYIIYILRLRIPDELVFIGILVTATVLAAIMFWPLSRYLAPGTNAEKKELVSLLFQVMGGAIVIAGVYLTWQELKTSKESQITDRFTRAVDQLGKSDDEEKDKDKKGPAPPSNRQKNLAIRLGGIFALQRIAQDSDRDHPAIMEILTAYLRQHALEEIGNEPPPADSSDPAIPQDIQAILTVIGNRALTYQNGEKQRHDLSGLNLRRAVLSEGNFNGVIMNLTHLERAQLNKACFVNAQLRDARLDGAFLEQADLTGADLRGANFSQATVTGTIFTDANLSAANLSGAIGLTQQQLDSARTDGNTVTDSKLKPRATP